MSARLFLCVMYTVSAELLPELVSHCVTIARVTQQLPSCSPSLSPLCVCVPLSLSLSYCTGLTSGPRDSQERVRREELADLHWPDCSGSSQRTERDAARRESSQGCDDADQWRWARGRSEAKAERATQADDGRIEAAFGDFY